MAIYHRLMGAPGAGGSVVLLCKRCRAVAMDAKTDVTILIVCPRCGTPLGEWATEAERDAELKEFMEKFRKLPYSKESASKGK